MSANVWADAHHSLHSLENSAIGPDCQKAGLEKEWGRSSCRFHAERVLSSERESTVKGTRAHRDQGALVAVVRSTLKQVGRIN